MCYIAFVMKNYLKNAVDHFKTITAHRQLVQKYCFRVGLYRQGLLHDLSKYSPSEFIPGVIYYQGTRSPNAQERDEKGYSRAWLHHKGRNRHHYEYWSDHLNGAEPGAIGPVRMPRRYVAEMFCDRVAASRIYNAGHYNDKLPLDYFLRVKKRVFMHDKTAKEIEYLLTLNWKKGEDYALDYIRKRYLKGKK